MVFAQPNTEVYLMDITSNDERISLQNFKNISQNPGYDSQPSFAFNYLLYAGSNDGQTEIKGYELREGVTVRFNKPTLGGEFSPQLIPNDSQFAAVRLDTTGLQRLYYYSTAGDSKLILPDAPVAYFSFYNKEIVLASILSDDELDLVLYNLTTNSADTIIENSGRSIHNIPNKEAMSYTVVNEEGNYDVFQLDMKTKESFFICQLPIGIQDHTWLDSNRLLIGSTNKLYVYDTFEGSEWKEIVDLSSYPITDITRLAVDESGKKLALVAMPVE
ncbi:hypothetical protein ULVI_12135 [Cochleicola gelatinilyticus]|uniref:Uncharacterized protein n=2 Tax=Cochleicola gelatinilyticus TaxID=1763537 RepID=A0A167H4W7_9FLAO|nr:hypothetical protein ULVI_12135 [Cochleicola gelatinilyticus]